MPDCSRNLNFISVTENSVTFTYKQNSYRRWILSSFICRRPFVKPQEDWASSWQRMYRSRNDLLATFNTQLAIYPGLTLAVASFITIILVLEEQLCTLGQRQLQLHPLAVTCYDNLYTQLLTLDQRQLQLHPLPVYCCCEVWLQPSISTVSAQR